MSKKAWKKAPGFKLAEQALVDLVRKCANTLSLYLAPPQPLVKGGEVVFSGPLKGLPKEMAYKYQMQAMELTAKYMGVPIINILKTKLSLPSSPVNTPIEAFVKALGEHGGRMAIDMGSADKGINPVAKVIEKTNRQESSIPEESTSS